MSIGKLTTHVLDLSTGLPAAGLNIDLHFEGVKIYSYTTNSDGRVDRPLLDPTNMVKGVYELVFHAGDYLKSLGHTQEEPQEEPMFLDQIPIRFGINDTTRHYHVPLLLSPFGYSTYRGS